MNWLEHEYFMPVIIGNDGFSLKVAKRIYKSTGIKAHVFAEKFSVLQRLAFNCHKIAPQRDEFLLESLLSFAQSIEEYYCPVIVVCNDECRRIVERLSETIESVFIVVDHQELFV